MGLDQGRTHIRGMCESWLKKHPRGEHEPLLAELARLSRFEYDRRRKAEAKRLGIQLDTLDREVAKLRAQAASQKDFLPHWSVEPWPEHVDGAALLDALRAYFNRYVVLPEHADVALALWTLNTWTFESFDIAPYLSITSPTRRCGKTVLMTLLYWLCRRGKKSDNMSKAAIYRSVDTEQPTLVLDEVGWVADTKDERQGILCGGFERNGYVEVCEGEGLAITTRLFSTFCPKAFGLIGQLTATLTNRSIVILMRRKMPREKAERLRHRAGGLIIGIRYKDRLSPRHLLAFLRVRVGVFSCPVTTAELVNVTALATELAFACHHSRRDPANERDHFGGLRQR